MEFKCSLQQLVPMLLSPQNLVPKLINGQKVKAKDLVQYFKSYMSIYKGNELPEPKSMLVVMKPTYQTCLEKGMEHAAAAAAERALGGAAPALAHNGKHKAL